MPLTSLMLTTLTVGGGDASLVPDKVMLIGEERLLSGRKVDHGGRWVGKRTQVKVDVTDLWSRDESVAMISVVMVPLGGNAAALMVP